MLSCFAIQAFAQQKLADKSSPNIVLILADDIGYGDLGVYGQKIEQTPHLDSLAAAGMRFTDYYAGDAVCAPSRESMLTGMDTGHTFIRGNFLTDQQEDPAMPDSEVTVAELLKKGGYQTALIGKWGLGGEGHGPETQGFDYSVCYLDQIKAHNYYPSYLYENGKRIYLHKNKNGKKGLSSADFFLKKTLQYIDTVNTHKPFFLYLPYTYPHGAYEVPVNPIYAKKKWSHSLKVYASMVTELDEEVEHVVQALKKRNLLPNTLVLFASDNGANLIDAKTFKSNGNLRAGKRFLYEGGIREPLIAYWKGKIKSGQVSRHMTAAWDMLPTFCQLAQIKPSKHIDGISFLPTLLGEEKKQKEHKYLYWEYYQYNYNWYKPGNTLPRNYLTNRAVRFGKWAAVQNHLYRDKNSSIELYNLSTDLSEQNDVAKEHPALIKKVKGMFEKSSTLDPPFFPYVADSVAKLHTLDIYTPQQLKKFFHYTKDRIPFVSSHRGGPTLGYPENCIPTFRHTLRHTWSIMEVDPHYTKDSSIVLMHDPTLDRTSTGHGKISDHTLAELEKLNLKDDRGNVTKFKIPTLDKALKWAKGKTILILDHKDVPATVRAKKIMEHHAETNAMVMCYTYKAAKKVYDIDKNIMMEVFIPNRKSARKFAKADIPWSNIVAFITHYKPKDPGVFQYLHSKGVMTIRGSEFNIDKEYRADKISKKQLEGGYRKKIQSGTDIIEANLGVQAGLTLQKMWPAHSSKRKYFKY
jgi:arylsulfatase A-like enzyme/glycerophosphoryl diester phosphodiesterase